MKKHDLKKLTIELSVYTHTHIYIYKFLKNLFKQWKAIQVWNNMKVID